MMNSKKGISELWWIIISLVVFAVAAIIIIVIFRGQFGAETKIITGELGKSCATDVKGHCSLECADTEDSVLGIYKDCQTAEHCCRTKSS